MRTARLIAVIIMVCTAGAVSAVAAGPGPVVQPTDAPGEMWKLYANPMPPIETIIARPVEARPVYGLYGWRGEYQTFRDSIRKRDFRNEDGDLIFEQLD